MVASLGITPPTFRLPPTLAVGGDGVYLAPELLPTTGTTTTTANAKKNDEFEKQKTELFSGRKGSMKLQEWLLRWSEMTASKGWSSAE